MNLLKKILSTNELPKEYAELIGIIRKNHDSAGGANRAAVAELQARSAWELNKATKGLRTATWILAFSTVVLCVITLYSGQ